MLHILLASQSPRRKALIEQMGWAADLISASFTEAETPEVVKAREAELPDDVLSSLPEVEWVPLFNAYGKASAAAWEIYADDPRPLVAADTVVALGDEILGKPKDEADACRMLRELSGKIHTVITALCLISYGETYAHIETTKVHFRSLTDEEIEEYIATGEPMDKAGAYGIQGRGALLVSSIEGDYNNVVGLPLTALYEMMKKADVKGCLSEKRKV